MRHARLDYDRIQDPAGLIGEDEPVFLLRAKDLLAPGTLRYWAKELDRHDGDPRTIERVLAFAEEMENWQHKHGAKIPDTPEP